MKIEGGKSLRKSAVLTVWISIADLSANGDVSVGTSAIPVERHAFLERLVTDDIRNLQSLLAALKGRC